MNRIVWMILPALLLAGAAQAQVAVPELVPAAPRVYESGLLGVTSATVTPDNPAAIVWGEPSRVAFGRIELDTENPAVAGSKVSHSGYYAGYRGVGDGFSLGVEHVTMSEEGAGFYEEENTNGHIGFEVVEGLSLGAALEKSEANNGTVTDKLDSTVLGLSIKLQDKFYLGYAIIDDEFNNSTGVQDSRDGSMLGIALRLEGGLLWHLAYDKVDRDDFTGAGPGLGYDHTTFTVQAASANWAFGVAKSTVKGKGAGAGELESMVYDLAWAPEKGLGVGVRLADTDTTDASGAVVQEAKMLGVSISYIF